MKSPVRAWIRIVAVLSVTLAAGTCARETQEEPMDESSAESTPEAGEAGLAQEVAQEEMAVRGEELMAEEGEGEHGAREGEGGEGEGEHGEGEGREGEGEQGEGDEGEGEHGEEGEHGAEGEESGEEGEESGEYLEPTATWDATRRGARLILSFDAAQGAFVGTVENTTQQTLCAVRVEVHLSGGPELGPTPRTDLPAGGSTEVVLSAEGESFDAWTAHPEVSACDR